MELESLTLGWTSGGTTQRYAGAVERIPPLAGLQVVFDDERTAQGRRIRLTVNPEARLVLTRCALHFRHNYQADERLLLNGYQTWTQSREFGIDEKIPPLNSLARPVLNHYQMYKYGDYLFFPNRGKRGYLHGYTYGTIRRGNQWRLIGSLSEAQGFTILEHATPERRMNVIKDCTGVEISAPWLAFDLLIDEGSEQGVFDHYFAAMAVPPITRGDLVGWTSWYKYYTTITEDIIAQNLEAFASRQLPIDVFQIDDGWQQAVGDWLSTNAKFPHGMKPMADRIHQRGYRAGLWLAPFICEEKSALLREHPDWVLKDDDGRPLAAGCVPNWSGKFYAIDIEHPGFRAYLTQVFDLVLNQWGFDMVKLDFLYAAALQHRRNKTRGQLMVEGMAWLRELVGDKILLGCGVPLGAAFGRADYCRIGCDIALKWEDNLLKHVLRYRERVSTRSAIDSAIGRRQLNYRAFINGPDVFLLRENNLQLSAHQKETLFIVNLIFGGLLFTSDNLDEYDEAAMTLYRSQFPLKPRTVDAVEDERDLATVRFHSGDRHYLALINLSAQVRPVSLPAGDWLKAGALHRDKLRLEPYQTQCFLAMNGAPDAALLDSRHLFPGMDV